MRHTAQLPPFAYFYVSMQSLMMAHCGRNM